MNVINVAQRSPEWAAWRAAGVTASEAAVVLSRSPYMTPWRLWAERTGLAKPDDLSRNPFVRRGIAYEDQARQGFEDRHATILLPICAQSNEHPVLRCSLDGLSDADEPVELKVPTDKTYQDVAAQREQSVAYQLYWVQVQFQILVTGAQRGWLVFDPCRARTPALEFAVTPDETFLRRELIPACLAFWQAIDTGKGPEPDPQRDLYLPVADELAQWMAAASEYRDLAAERHDLETSLKGLKSRMDEAEDALVGLMGEFLLAETGGVRVARYLQNGSVDYASLLKDLAPALDDSILDKYRRRPSERVRVTVQSETVPAPAAQALTAPNCFYF
jgi:putative phage-type endonuclease